MAVFTEFANYLIKLSIDTELKTFWSIDDKEGVGGAQAPYLLP